MRFSFSVIFVLMVMVFPGCDGSDESNKKNNTSLNPNVAPVTEGSWYRPEVLVSWQWQLSGSVNTSYPAEIYDVDLFDVSLGTIQELKSSGKKVICYFSAGSYENFRDDKDQFLPEELGRTLDDWKDERWLDIRSSNVHKIMKSRLDLAREKGCHGVEADNVDGYVNNSGFDLTAKDQLAFNRFIANEAHNRGLSIGLKNDLDQIAELVDYFDFSVNEQCFEYSECDKLLPFIRNGKPVLNAEYLNKYVTDESERSFLCSKSINYQFSTLILPLYLNDEFRFSCLNN